MTFSWFILRIGVTVLNVNAANLRNLSLHSICQPGSGRQRSDFSGQWRTLGPGQTARTGLLS